MAFYEALVSAEVHEGHIKEELKFFEGCVPIEELARRGPETMRYGPMRPVGLIDPRTGKRPYAVVQLRKENIGGDLPQPGRLSDAAEVGRAKAGVPPDSRLARGGVRPLRRDAPQHLSQLAEGAAADLPGKGPAPTCSSPARSRASKGTWSRRARA